MEAEQPRVRGHLTRDAMSLAVASVLGQGAGIVATIVLARLLSRHQFGSYQQLLLVYGVIAPLLLGGIPAALSYFIASSPRAEDRQRIVFVGLVSLAALGVLAAAVLLTLREPLARALHNPGLSSAFVRFSPYVALTFVAAALPNTLVPIGRARLSAVVSALLAFVFVAATLAVGIATRTATGLAAAMSGFSVVSATATVLVISRTVGLEARWQGLIARAVAFLGYGLPLALTGVAGMLGYQLDRIVVSTHFRPSEFAIYAVGAVELPIVPIIQQSVNSVLMPALTERFQRGDTPGAGALWRGAIRRTSLVLLPAFAFSMVLAGSIIRTFFGARYGDSVTVFRIYLVLMPIRVATYGLLPMAAGRTRVNLGAALVLLISNAVLAIALVGPLGLPGPAVATVIATAASVGYYLIRLRRIVELPLRDLFPWRLVATNLALSAAAAAVVVPLALAPVPDPIRLATAAPLYAAVYLAIMRAARRIDDHEWAWLRSLFERLRIALTGARLHAR